MFVMQESVTEIIKLANDGNTLAVERLFTVVYDELKSLAARRLKKNAPGQTLQSTDLVHETFIKLLPIEDRSWQNRHHFFNSAACAMRSIVVDRARAKLSLKRGEGLQVELPDDNILGTEKDPSEVIALHEALEKLEAVDERAAKVVSLRVFAGLTRDEISEVLSVSDRTISRDWKFARAWLWKALGNGDRTENE